MTRILFLMGIIIFVVMLARIGPALRESQDRRNAKEMEKRKHCAELGRIYTDDSARAKFFEECIR